jgi:hypothetical protein
MQLIFKKKKKNLKKKEAKGWLGHPQDLGWPRGQPPVRHPPKAATPLLLFFFFLKKNKFYLFIF